MNPYEELKALNAQYHAIMEKVFQMEVTDEDKIEAKAEFAARANNVLLMMKQSMEVVKPFFEETK